MPTRLLASFYDFATDGPLYCGDAGAKKLCSTVAIYKSLDAGVSWTYASRIDQTLDMPSGAEGPCEASLVQLDSKRVLVAFRIQSKLSLWGPGMLKLEQRSPFCS